MIAALIAEKGVPAHGDPALSRRSTPTTRWPPPWPWRSRWSPLWSPWTTKSVKMFTGMTPSAQEVIIVLYYALGTLWCLLRPTSGPPRRAWTWSWLASTAWTGAQSRQASSSNLAKSFCKPSSMTLRTCQEHCMALLHYFLIWPYRVLPLTPVPWKVLLILYL